MPPSVPLTYPYPSRFRDTLSCTTTPLTVTPATAVHSRLTPLRVPPSLFLRIYLLPARCWYPRHCIACPRTASDPAPPLALPSEAPVAMTSAGLTAMHRMRQRMRSRPGPVFGTATPHNLGADSNALSAPRGAWLGNRLPPSPRSIAAVASRSGQFAERPLPNALTSPRGGWLREMLVQNRQRGIEHVEDPTTPLYTQTTPGPTEAFRNARWRSMTGNENISNADASTVADSVAKSQASSSPGASGPPRRTPRSSSGASEARASSGSSLGGSAFGARDDAFGGRDAVFSGVSHTNSGTSTGEVRPIARVLAQALRGLQIPFPPPHAGPVVPRGPPALPLPPSPFPASPGRGCQPLSAACSLDH